MSYRYRITTAALCAAAAALVAAGMIAALGSTLWQDDGVVLCTAVDSQENPKVVPDGSGGAIVTWGDYRGNSSDIFAQRVDALGNILWRTDGITVCYVDVSSQSKPQIVSDGSGGAIVTWEDSRHNASVYAQRVSSGGTALWATNGVSVCVPPAGPYANDPQLVPDRFGGAIVTWMDGRHGGMHIYAQRMNSDGTRLWATDGVSLCTNGSSQDPHIATDGYSGAIVTWRLGNDVYAQRVDSLGSIRWGASAVGVCTESGTQSDPRIIPDGSGGAIVTWRDYRHGSTNSDIFAQRVDADGNPLWQTDGVTVCAASKHQYDPDIASDGSGGTIVTWTDCRSAILNDFDIYAQRLDADGNALWTADGVSLCSAENAQLVPQIAADGSGGAVVAWADWRSGTYYDIYAQQVDADGTVLWAADGMSLCVASYDQLDPAIASDGFWGAIVAWCDYRDPPAMGPGTLAGTSDIYAQRVSGEAVAVCLPLVAKRH